MAGFFFREQKKDLNQPDTTMLIEIKNRFTGEVIFSHAQENNTVKITLGLAIEAKADLYGANLTGANLSRANLSRAYLTGANLTGANLSRANLSRAYLTGANLTGANLSRANLSRADLTGADLTGADLTGAYLTGAIGNMSVMFSMQIETYPITFTKDVIQIGCKRHSHDEWRNFDDETIKGMDLSALAFWKKWKDFIFMAIDLKFNNNEADHENSYGKSA